MIIDFHTHCWPEKIATKTLNLLEHPPLITAHTSGTAQSLSLSLTNAGYDLGVVMPIATKASSVKHINEFAAQISHGNLLSFGTIYPEADSWRADMDYVKKLNLQGIKLHPAFQSFYIDSDRICEIAEYASYLHLPLLFHAGNSYSYPNDPHYSAARAKRLIRTVPTATIILAHMGGLLQWDAVEQDLVGENCYFDTSTSLQFMEPARFQRMVLNHGADKILYGTDSPWADLSESYHLFMSIDFSKPIQDKILFENAERILNQ